MKTEDIARVCHEANRGYCETLGDNSMAVWSETPDWQRKGMINGVEFFLTYPGSSPEDMHKNWLVRKTEAGWVYGEVKDVGKKTHPCILPYDKLPFEQRLKDEIFLAIIKVLDPEPHFGTVEPVFKKTDQADTAAFLRGFVGKYKNSSISRDRIFKYLDGLTNFQR